MRVTHDNGKTDRRYKVAREYCGQARPAYVARFCGQFLTSAATDWQAWLECAAHKARQLAAMNQPNQPRA